VNVAVLGASDNPERYSYKAVMRLKEGGYTVFPVNPKLKSIEGTPVFASMSDLPKPVDTVTLYVSPEISSKLAEAILAVQPRRIIFNPGSENPDLAAQAEARGIHTVSACTLVLLSTHQFDRA